MRRALLPLLLLGLLAPAAPAGAALKVVGVFGSQGSAPGQLSQTEDVTTDAQGNVYVASAANARVDKFSQDGTYLMSFGSRGSAAGQLGEPVGVAVAEPGGQVYVSDFDGSRGRITEYAPDGTLIRTFGSVGTGDGQFRSPGAIAVDSHGSVYVGDTGNNRVQKFTADGVFVTKWGTSGAGDGQFANPRGITIEPDGNVLVADRDNGRVQRFSPDGAFLGQFGTPVTPTGRFSSVYDVFAAPKGDVFTADNGLFDIEKFQPDDTFVYQANPANTFDGTPAAGLRPVSVTEDSNGNVYAVGTQSPAFVAKFAEVAPQPVLAQTATAQALKGTVLVKAPGSSTFAPLSKGAATIPIGSTVDTTKGTIKLVTATGQGTATQTGRFNGGQFRLLQKAAGKGLIDLVMQGGNLQSCRAGKASAAAAHGRRLFGDAHGRYRTRGRYSTATVRGTRWLVKDSCGGTLTKVLRGKVLVRDLVKRRNVLVRQGHSYLARAKAK